MDFVAAKPVTVTVITVVRNAAAHIERTVRSLLAQTYPRIQYIVQDGASTDGTLERLQGYAAAIHDLRSEPDTGISDAWNRALVRADGDIVGLLNAGDEYYPDTVAKAVAGISKGADVVYGDTELVDDEGQIRRLNRGRFHLWRYSAGLGFYHPSMFARRAIYDRVGTFDPSLRFAMDTDWMIRASVAGARFAHVRMHVRMLDGGVSVRNRFLAYGEHLDCLRRAGLPESVVYRSMLMTGTRGLVRLLIKGPRLG